jgi:hypothetical protein
MDAVLRVVLQQINAQADSAVRLGRSGDGQAAAAELMQAGMTLGMQVGHFRAILGHRYPASPEAEAIRISALKLGVSLTLAFAEQESESDDDDGEDDDIEHDSTEGVPDYYPADPLDGDDE